MGTRSVRLDDQSERLLAALEKDTGLSVTDLLKQGIVALAQLRANDASAYPYDVFRTLDLGRGGDAVARARDAKGAIRDVLERKLRRARGRR